MVYWKCKEKCNRILYNNSESQHISERDKWMAKGTNQKLKILYLMRILLEKTDETHSMTMPEILEALESYGIHAERKSIYSDIESLRLFGLDIIGEQNDRTYYYHVGSRRFELAELKLLVDSVQSAKFITAKKTKELIKKIGELTSHAEASQLQRQMYIFERVKAMNESIYYNVDKLHTAINSNVRITFQYFQWNVHKEMVLRRDGDLYEVSPWALSWDDENYYLIAYDHRDRTIKHFRVDKMLNIEMMREKREGSEQFRAFDLAVYARKTFGMYRGEEEMVTLECENSLVGAIIDRFGQGVSIVPTDENHFVAHAKVAVSRHFFGWIIALGEGVRITGPDEVVRQMKEEVERLRRQYEV